MSNIIPMTLYNIPGFLITTPNGCSGIFAYKDEGERPRKRKAKGQDPLVQKWKKVWLVSVYKSERYPDMPWRYRHAGGKYAFSRCHFDPEQFVLLFELLPFIYREFFGVVAPWNTPVEIKKEFKPKTADDEVARLERELAGLRA